MSELDTFVGALRNVRLLPEEAAQLRSQLVARMQRPDVLYAYEKAIIFAGLQRVQRGHPQRARMEGESRRGQPVYIAMWHGINLFKSIQPFFVEDASSARA